MEPFRDDQQAALLRAAKLEEENENLRAELARAHDAAPKAVAPTTANPRYSAFIALAVVLVLIGIGVMMATTLMPRPVVREVIVPVVQRPSPRAPGTPKPSHEATATPSF